MATMTRPGVYVSEAPLARVVTPPVATSSVGVFIGTALKGPTDPTPISSWSDFTANFGDFATGMTLPVALFQYFRNGGGQAYVSRVTGTTGLMAATSTFSDDAAAATNKRLKFDAKEGGIWGNNFGYDIELENPGAADPTKKTFLVAIYENYRGAKVTMERFVGLSMVPSNPRYVQNIVNSPTIGSRYVTVTDVSTTNAPPITAGSPLRQGTSSTVFLTGGVDGTGTIDYGAAFDEYANIDALLVVNIPGVSAVSAIATKCQERGDSFLVVDTPENTLPAAATPTALGLPETSYCGVYYPWIYIADPTPSAPRGSVLKIPPGASVAGMILRTEATRGVFKAPAGMAAGLSGAVAAERRLTNDELDTLASAKVNAIRTVSGSGIVTMGARGNSNDIAQYISVRRTLNWVKKRAVESSRFALFEPNNEVLWEQLVVANQVYLLDLWKKGGLAGIATNQAFYVKCDRDNNTPTTISNGEVHVEIGIAPVFPAEFVIIRVGQFESDSSVVVQEV